MKPSLAYPWAEDVGAGCGYSTRGPLSQISSPGAENAQARRRPNACGTKWSMQLTARDVRMVELLGRSRVLLARQFQIAEFGLEHDSRCQARLTKLVADKWIDVMPGRVANQPAVYVLSRRSPNGIKLLKERWGEQEFARYMTRIWNVEHLLGINEVKVRLMRACLDLGFQFQFWLRSEDLEPLLKSQRLIPDGYARTQRLVDGEPKQAAFFVEFEQSVKSHAVIREKLTHYARLIQSGEYEQLFAHEATPRVLFVFAASYHGSSLHRVRATMKLAQELGASFVRAAGLETIKAEPPTAMLTRNIWAAPRDGNSVALFS